MFDLIPKQSIDTNLGLACVYFEQPSCFFTLGIYRVAQKKEWETVHLPLRKWWKTLTECMFLKHEREGDRDWGLWCWLVVQLTLCHSAAVRWHWCCYVRGVYFGSISISLAFAFKLLGNLVINAKNDQFAFFFFRLQECTHFALWGWWMNTWFFPRHPKAVKPYR